MGSFFCKGSDVYHDLPPGFFKCSAKTIDEANFELSQLDKAENRAFLVVNVATK
jgi:hypothetical protein